MVYDDVGLRDLMILFSLIFQKEEEVI